MSVSIIIPMRNEEKFVSKCLDSVLHQIEGRDDFEIFCIDGASTDSTRRIVLDYRQRDKRIHLIDNPHRIVPVAMNLGIKQAAGDIIMRLDSHAEYGPNYIDKCLEVLQRTRADNVGGYWTTLPGKNTPVARAIAAATSCGFGVGNSAFRLTGPEKETDTVPFGTYRRDLFDKIGLFDERLVRNQDIELNSRIRQAGGRIIISPEIKLSYYNRATFRGLWQQAFNNGLWNPYTIWLVGSGLSLRHFVPAVFVLGIIGLGVGAFFYGPLRWVSLAYILTYLFAAAVFSMGASRGKRCSVILIVWSFIVLHIAYGLGSLWAIITIPLKFPNRRKKHIGKALADRKA